MMKVLILMGSPYPHLGGMSTHVKFLEEGLKKRGHEVYIISLSSYPRVVRYLLAGVWMFFNKVKRGLGHFIRNLIYVLITNVFVTIFCSVKKVDIIETEHVTSFHSTWLSRALLRIPVNLTVHGYPTYERVMNRYLDKNSHLLITLSIIEEIKAYSEANYVLTVDSRIKRYITSLVRRSNILTLPNFVDVKNFKFIFKNVSRL